jgi:hypothetical protein
MPTRPISGTTAFFAKVLGPNLKHSSCFHQEPASTLQEAEEEALRQTVEHADLADNPRNRTHNPVSPQKPSQIQGDSFV